MRKEMLTVIIPAYKQEKTIVADLRNIELVLKALPLDYELICVIDGKLDKTFERAKKLASSKIKVVGYEQNRGKGYAVRYGMARAQGDLVAFIDAGMDIDPHGISMILEHLKWYDADIVIGSKRHPASEVVYPFSRRVLSFMTQLMVLFLFGLKVKDTQVGLKIFKKRVLQEVLPRLVIKRFAFDVELLAVARKLGYRKIYEAPIKLVHKNYPSSVRITGPNGVFSCFRDALGVFYRLKVIHYYDDNNKRKWFYDKELAMKVNLP